jgi:hypothetical protein
MSTFNLVKMIACICLFVLVSIVLKAQSLKPDTMLLKGIFFGKDLYVKNPYFVTGEDTIYTVQQVIVNDSLVLNRTQLQKPAFAIPLTRMPLKQGVPITIQIVQCEFGRAQLLNPTYK